MDKLALYAIWQNHNVIGYIRLTPEQATSLNKIKNLGVYFGFDETTKMTLEGAIAHAQEVAKTADCAECREEHQQLADWLTELKKIKEEEGKCCARWTPHVRFGEVDHWECSNCGFEIKGNYFFEGTPCENNFFYCPCCKFKMKEGE